MREWVKMAVGRFGLHWGGARAGYWSGRHGEVGWENWVRVEVGEGEE